MAWQTPKMDWNTNPTNPLPADFNRIEGNIDFLNTDIETKKGLIVDAINTMGRSVTIANTHAELATAIKDISDDATAAVEDVILGKTFYQGRTKKTGTIPSKSASTITPGTANQVIAANQYLTGVQTIVGDPDLAEENIKSGVTIFGKTGTFDNAATLGTGWVLSPVSEYYGGGDSDVFTAAYFNFGCTKTTAYPFTLVADKPFAYKKYDAGGTEVISETGVVSSYSGMSSYSEYYDIYNPNRATITLVMGGSSAIGWVSSLAIL